jgi:spermidine synthase
VAWQRILALQSGVGLYSIAMIVGAFMAGLGLGSWLGGAWSARVSGKRALLTFAALELGIGAFGAVSCTFYYDWLYVRGAWLYATTLGAALVHFSSLLLPTCLMGMSLPFLVRGTLQETAEAGRAVGLLYGVNLLGASLGALLTPWVLIRHLGIRGAVLAAVAGNVIAATLVLAMRARAGDSGDSSTEGPDPGPQLDLEPRRSFALWLNLYALSGFCALSLEILWFRIVDVGVKSDAFTFGTVLCVYLAGSAVGSLVGARRVQRVRRPLRAFLLCQCLLLACAAAAVTLLTTLPESTPLLQWFYLYWGLSPLALVNVEGAATLVKLYVVLPVFLYGLPTVLMGFSFPILQRAVHDDIRTSGRKVGFLQAANIAGCLAGSLLVGLVLLTWLGTMGTLRLLVVAGVVFAILGLRLYGARSPFSVVAPALVVLLLLVPGQRAFWLRLHGTKDPGAVASEDATGVSALTPRRAPQGGVGWRVWVNGKSHSDLPFGGVHTALGAAPALIHPEPRTIAIIGLGSGDTAWAAGCRREATKAVTVFELLAPERVLLEGLTAHPPSPPKLERFLTDPRVEFVVADGRNAIERSEPVWDIIEMDPLFPHSAYAGNLYSAEFFAHCARKLLPGGLMCSWAPTARVRASFGTAFPYVLELGARSNPIVVGSLGPISFDLATWRQRAFSPQVQAYLGPGRAQEVFRDYLRTAGAMDSPGKARLNHDLFPRDEFVSPE